MKMKSTLCLLLVVLLIVSLSTTVFASNQYPAWDINEAKTVTLKDDEIVQYHLTPSESGKYMVRSTDDIRFEVIDDAGDMLGTDFITSDSTKGIVFDLVAGKKYTVMLQKWVSQNGTVTGTFCFEKVGAVKSASIYVAGFGRDYYILGLDTEPICGHLEGVTWSVSNPSIFRLCQLSDTSIELEIRGEGNTTVTATVGDVSATIELSSKPKLPVVPEGETTPLTIGGTAAEFIASDAGYYHITLIPDRTMSFRIFDDADNDLLFNKEILSEKFEFTMWMKAGQTYELWQQSGRCSVSVEYVGESSSQDGTTPPTSAPTQPATSAPTSPTESTAEPTEATQPSTTDATAPTETTLDQDIQDGDQPIKQNDNEKPTVLRIAIPVLLLGGGIAAFIILKNKKK